MTRQSKWNSAFQSYMLGAGIVSCMTHIVLTVHELGFWKHGASNALELYFTYSDVAGLNTGGS